MKKRVVTTDEGFRKLERELEELKTVRRKEVSEKIKTALSFGDLSENSEYDEAKNEQAMVESRIVQLEAMLKNVQILEESDISIDSVSVGVGVTLEDLEQKDEVTYYIVSTTEVDPFNFKISDDSPIGKALMSHKVGDKVVAETPSGHVKFKILKIFK
ncbi:MAG: transcription elongation factor GreA [Oscillospiraceae bacterium]|nr:transcription elongation factor GreA [Oscillospiraceae bacterium]